MYVKDIGKLIENRFCNDIMFLRWDKVYVCLRRRGKEMKVMKEEIKRRMNNSKNWLYLGLLGISFKILILINFFKWSFF